MATQRQRIWGWWFYDWASQPYNTLLLTFIFGPYFAEVARGYYMGAGLEEEAAKAAAQAYWGFGLAVAALIAADRPLLCRDSKRQGGLRSLRPPARWLDAVDLHHD